MISLMATKADAGRTGYRTLAVISLAQFVIALDYSIVYLALPAMAKSLALDAALSQWIVSAYGLAFAGFLLPGGRICDRLGAHNAFVVSLSLFSIASLLGGLAPSGAWLMLARGAQGVSAAVLQPAIVSLIARHFTPGAARAKALSIWGAVGAAGLVAGVVLGGLFTLASWRLVFFVNVPIAWLCLWLGKRPQRDSEAADMAARIPWWSSLLGTLAVTSVVLWLTSLAQRGMDNAHSHAWAGAAAVLLGLFLINETRGPQPLVARELRHLHTLRTGCWASAFYMASLGAEFFLLTLLLQNVYGYGALNAGLAFLPLAVMIIIGNVLAGKLISGQPAVKVLFWGFALGAAGLWLMALAVMGRIPHGLILPGLLISGLAHGMIYTANFVVGLTALPQDKQGAAGGLMVTAQYAGGAIALSMLVMLLGYYPGVTGFFYAFGLLTFFACAGALVALLAQDAP